MQIRFNKKLYGIMLAAAFAFCGCSGDNADFDDDYSSDSSISSSSSDGLSFLPEDMDAESMVLVANITSTQVSRLASLGYFPLELMEISNSIYKKFNDDFDFIFFVLDKDDRSIINSLGFYGVNLGISNDVGGIGLEISSGSRDWGSDGKLKSVMYFPSYDAILRGPTLHELAHNWAAYICPTYFPDNSRAGVHWGVSNAGGQLGGFKYVRVVEENSGGVLGRTKYQASMYEDTNRRDGSFRYGGFGVYANNGNSIPYSDVELYLMGMISEQELRDKNFTLDIYSENDYDESFDDGYFYSSKVTSYTIDDIIELSGPRLPGSGASQKEFKVLTVVLTDASDESRLFDIIKNISWFSGPEDDDSYSEYRSLYNFSKATNGVGSLVASGVKNSLKGQL
jgi:hypothetical protein